MACRCRLLCCKSRSSRLLHRSCPGACWHQPACLLDPLPGLHCLPPHNGCCHRTPALLPCSSDTDAEMVLTARGQLLHVPRPGRQPDGPEPAVNLYHCSPAWSYQQFEIKRRNRQWLASACPTRPTAKLTLPPNSQQICHRKHGLQLYNAHTLLDFRKRRKQRDMPNDGDSRKKLLN